MSPNWAGVTVASHETTVAAGRAMVTSTRAHSLLESPYLLRPLAADIPAYEGSGRSRGDCCREAVHAYLGPEDLMSELVGRRFVDALAARDEPALRRVLAQDVDFRGMTPRESFESADVDGVIRTVFGRWIDPTDTVEECVGGRCRPSRRRSRAGRLPVSGPLRGPSPRYEPNANKLAPNAVPRRPLGRGRPRGCSSKKRSSSHNEDDEKVARYPELVGRGLGPSELLPPRTRARVAHTAIVAVKPSMHTWARRI